MSDRDLVAEAQDGEALLSQPPVATAIVFGIPGRRVVDAAVELQDQAALTA